MQTRGRAGARRTERSSRGSATSVGSIAACILIQATQTISAAGAHGRTRAGLIIIGNHRLRFALAEFREHVVNHVGFQAVDVIQSRSTDRELHVDVFQHQLPNRRVFSRCGTVILDAVAPLSASVAGLHAELIRRTIGSYGTRQTTHRVVQTQSNEHGVIRSTTTLIVTTGRQRRGFRQVRLHFAFVSEDFEALLADGLASHIRLQLLTDLAVHVTTHSLMHGLDDRRSRSNFGFQRSDLLSKLSLGSFDSFFGLCRDFFGLCNGRRLNRVQFFNDDLRHD